MKMMEILCQPASFSRSLSIVIWKITDTRQWTILGKGTHHIQMISPGLLFSFAFSITQAQQGKFCSGLIQSKPGVFLTEMPLEKESDSVSTGSRQKPCR